MKYPCVHSAGQLCPLNHLQTQPYTVTTKCCLNLNQPPLLQNALGFWWWIKSQCGSLQNAFAKPFCSEKRVAVKNHDSLLNGFWNFHSKSLVHLGSTKGCARLCYYKMQCMTKVIQKLGHHASNLCFCGWKDLWAWILCTWVKLDYWTKRAGI